MSGIDVFQEGGLEISFSKRELGEYWRSVSSSSDAIKVSRVFCIFFMSYVHLHFFGLDLYGSEIYMAVRAIIVDVLGRSSVPLLSIISGFLAWGIFQRKRNSDVFKDRARKILVPMILWNSVGVFLLFLKSEAPQGVELLNGIFALAGPGVYAHLDFLRDIYVMTLITPFLVLFARRTPLLLALFSILLCVCNFDIYIVVRNQIFIFYVVGIFFALYRIELIANDLFFGVLLILIFAGVSVVELAELYGYFSVGYYYDNFFRRPFMVVFSWFLCVWIARGPLIRFFVFLERYVFLFFLSHVFLFTLMGAIFYRVEFLHSKIAYAVFWLVSPVLAYALVVSARIFWARLFRRERAAVQSVE